MPVRGSVPALLWPPTVLEVDPEVEVRALADSLGDEEDDAVTPDEDEPVPEDVLDGDGAEDSEVVLWVERWVEPGAVPVGWVPASGSVYCWSPAEVASAAAGLASASAASRIMMTRSGRMGREYGTVAWALSPPLGADRDGILANPRFAGFFARPGGSGAEPTGRVTVAAATPGVLFRQEHPPGAVPGRTAALRPPTMRLLPNRHPLSLRLLAATVACLVLLATVLTARSAGDLQSRIDSSRSAIGSLRSAIAADSARIGATAGGLQEAQRHLDGLQGQLSQRQAQLARTQRSLLSARDRLVALENRMQAATRALATNLRGNYEGSRPDLVSVILEARGFAELLERVSFLQRIGNQDATILGLTRSARAAVLRQAISLAVLERRDRTLTEQVLARRNQVAVLHGALLRRQIAQLGTRAGDSSKLHSLTGQLAGLEARAAAQARAAAAAAAAAAPAPAARGDAGGGGASSGGAANGGGAPGGIAVNTGGMVQAPAGAPAAVSQVIAAGNAIATLPYVWGGGHGSFHDSGYDCSGSISYALAAAGLLSSPLDSTGFESWGQAGPGRWITVYANAGHAFMVVAGWRFDTVALQQGGTRWSQSMTDTSAYVARHPPGL